MSGHGVDGGTLPDPRVEEVADGVLAYVQPDGGWWLNNAGFVVGASRVLAVDTCSTESRAPQPPGRDAGAPAPARRSSTRTSTATTPSATCWFPEAT